jgi:hypothetical protein
MPRPGGTRNRSRLLDGRPARGYSLGAIVDPDDPGRSAPTRNQPGGRSEQESQGSLRFWLEYRGHHFELREGLLNLGRSASCQLVLDDALVSRRHAQITVLADSVSVRDLGSANGVFVNGERVNGDRALRPGDRVLIGKQEILLRATLRSSLMADSSTHRFTAETLHGVDGSAIRQSLARAGSSAVKAQAPAPTPATGVPLDDDSGEATHQGDALELLGGVADKVLALGRGEEAERILSNYLHNMRDAAKSGDPPDARHAERAAHYAVKLAQATGRAHWVDFAFDLYRILQRPLPGPAVDQLYTVLRNVSGVSLPGLREYVAVLRAVQMRLGPAERFLVQRIEGLERLAALK